MKTILELIEKGESDILLSEGEHLSQFKELIKFELVEVKNDNFHLTEKGKKVQHLKIEEVLKQERLGAIRKKSGEAPKIMEEESHKNVWPYYIIFFMILLFAYFLFLNN